MVLKVAQSGLKQVQVMGFENNPEVNKALQQHWASLAALADCVLGDMDKKSKRHLMSETHRIREAQRGAEGRGNANETETVDAQGIERVEDEARQAGTTEGGLRNPNGEATAKNRKRLAHLAPRAEYAVCARTAHRDVSSPVNI